MEPYSKRFISEEAVLFYEKGEYAENSYASWIWDMQQKFLSGVLSHFTSDRPDPRLLDFACGTGRVLAFVRNYIRNCEGLDISPAMTEKARMKCPGLLCQTGDICVDFGICPGPFDLITSFRFLLNAEEEVRRSVLTQVRRRLKTGGVFIINMHGNKSSIRHFFILLRKLRAFLNPRAHESVMLEEMTLEHSRMLLRDAKFEIVEERGFGLLPSFLYKTPLRSMTAGIDRFFASRGLFSAYSIDLIFVCRAK